MFKTSYMLLKDRKIEIEKVSNVPQVYRVSVEQT